jgi:hypothetical protein
VKIQNTATFIIWPVLDPDLQSFLSA